jgi:hypothetical protein
MAKPTDQNLCVSRVDIGKPTPSAKPYIGPKGHVRLGTSPPSRNLYIANPNHNPPKQ